MAVITISREPGALGEEVAARVAGRLGFLLVDRARMVELWKEMVLDESRIQHADEELPIEKCTSNPETEACIKMLPDLIAQLAEEHDLVVVGRGGQGLFRNRPGTLHVRIVASRSFRSHHLQTREGLSGREARRQMRELESQREHYLRFMYRLNGANPCLYDLTLRMDRLTVEQALNLIVTASREMKLLDVPRRQIVEDLLSSAVERRGTFVNAAESEFARFLDFYNIPYEYEPRTFPLETDAEGKILEAFTPDFYLPEQDLYIELTTMKQSLVTRKNRKVKKLRRLYPEVNIRIFYQHDYYSLLAKYDLLTNKTDGSAGSARIDEKAAEIASTPVPCKTGDTC